MFKKCVTLPPVLAILLATATPVFAENQAQNDTLPATQVELSLTQQALVLLAQKKNTESLAMFEQALANGEGAAGFYIGRMLELGAMGQPNLRGAMPYYVRGAELNSPNALHRLGMAQFQGAGGLLQNYEKAQDLLCKSADLGHVQGMYNCAQLYTTDQGLGKDAQKALAYFQMAIEAGYTPAMVALAVIYDQGELVERDLQAGHDLLARAAGLGDPVGLFHMAASYERGQFNDQDLIQAHMYYNLASSRGHNDAAAEMARLAADMSPEDIKQAQAAAVQWLADRAGQSQQTQ